MGTAIFVLFYLALFDTVGTLVGVGHQAGLVRDGKLPRVDRALFADAVGTTVGAALGTSTITCYIESAAGVSDGARTGLASVVTGILLAASLFFSPLAAMIGGGVKVGQAVLYPTLAPALIVVGAMMLKPLRELHWDDPTEYLPAFLVLVGIPLTFSIADGIAFGLISYAIAKLATGRVTSTAEAQPQELIGWVPYRASHFRPLPERLVWRGGRVKMLMIFHTARRFRHVRPHELCRA